MAKPTPLVLALVFALHACGARRATTHEQHEQQSAQEAAGQAPESASAREAEPAAPGAANLSPARALVAEARSALKRSDYAAARASAAAAVAELLAIPQSEQDIDWAVLLHSAGVSAWQSQDIHSAQAAWQPAVEVFLRTLPAEDRRLQLARLNCASALQALGQLDDARALQQQVLAVYSRLLPDGNSELQDVRQNLALTLQMQGDLKGARELQEQVLEVCTRTLPDDDPNLQGARENLAGTYAQLGDLPRARILAEKVLDVLTRTLPDDHPELQRARLNLAGMLVKLGDCAGARPLGEQALEVLSRTLPAEHRSVQQARLNLAAALFMLGDLAGARALLEQALEVLARTLPDESPVLQTARSDLASVLDALGDLSGARVLEEKALEVNARTLPDDHPDLQMARLNLAATMKRLDDFNGARALEESVLEVYSRTLPDDHPDLQVARLACANTLFMLGDLAGARPLYEKLLDVAARTQPEDGPALRLARSNLAAALFMLGDFDGARALQEQVLELAARTLPDDHPDLQVARANLAWTIALQSARTAGAQVGVRERCLGLIGSLCRAQTAAAGRALLQSSAREAESRCAMLSGSLDICLSFAGGYGLLDPIPELQPSAFVLSETTRGAVLSSAALMRAGAGQAKYRESRETLRRECEVLSTLVQQGTTSERFHAALSRRDAAQRELVDLARGFSPDARVGLDFDVDLLRQTLSARAAVVAYRRYTRWTIDRGGTDSTASGELLAHRPVESLCAFVLRSAAATAPDAATVVAGAQRGGALQALTLVDLGPVGPIEDVVRAWRTSLGSGAEGRGLPVGQPAAVARGDEEQGRVLRRLVIDPLCQSLEGADHVIFALDDVLHLVPLDALPAGNAASDSTAGECLGDRLRIETSVTLTELLARAPARDQRGGLVVLGGVAYDVAQPDATSRGRSGGAASVGSVPDRAASRRAAGERAAGILRGGAWSGGFSDLPQSGVEARSIAGEFVREQGADSMLTILEGSAATRERLFESARGARWLHVATHGWFAPESIKSWKDAEPLAPQSGLAPRPSSEEQVRGMSPMLLCGLALAGANLPEDALGRAPGLITAEEISALDLSGCELAVLSACDTNVGERRGGQGVHSLQMALQMAGARSVITSLWKVPDEATKELMLDFYRRLWVEKKPKWQALWEAKKKLREAKDETGKPKYTTRDWAAWVLTGEPD